MSNKITEEVKELRRKWIKALRSGRYKQGCSVLCRIIGDNKYEYCCLGVLYKTLRQSMKKCEYNDNIMAFGENEMAYGLDDDTENKLKFSVTLCNKLVNMNDNGRSFKEIADYLEKLWKM